MLTLKGTRFNEQKNIEKQIAPWSFIGDWLQQKRESIKRGVKLPLSLVWRGKKTSYKHYFERKFHRILIKSSIVMSIQFPERNET